jgi:dTDP-4-dehydrorhamnose reductase
MKKLIVLGSNGQLGKKIVCDLEAFFDVTPLDRNSCDITKFDDLKELFSKYKPDIVINCAAYTNVDLAEKESKKCFLVNFNAVENLAKLSNIYDYTLIHFSTDYVFNSKKKTPIKENDTQHPINIYGKSKLKGEQAIEQISRKYYTFRISWVYSNFGMNFPKTILKLAKEKEVLDIVNDQYGCPTPVELISKIVHLALKKNIPIGTYNVSPDGCCSWYEIAQKILDYTNTNKSYILKNINGVSSSEFRSVARRPKFSLLDNNKIKDALDIRIDDWALYFKEFIHRENI